jgi:hypothetical protein
MMCFYPKDCGPVAANVSKLVVFNSSLTFVSCINVKLLAWSEGVSVSII